MSKSYFAVFTPNETAIQSLVKDANTLITCGIMLYISQGNTVYSIITGTLFTILLIGQVQKARKSIRDFRNKQDLQRWVDSLPDDDKTH